MSAAAVTLSQALATARSRFATAAIADPAGDARVLIAGLLGLSATQLIAGSDRMLSAEEVGRIEAAVERRLAFEPVHRILGKRAFFGLDLALSPATLEPRPDTEVLVERALPYLAEIISKKGNARLLDLGTGTGAIALALLQECPAATALATDISADALAVARGNAEANGLADRFQTLESNWFERLSTRFDMILSNPPYIVSSVIEDLAPDVKHFDPMAALDGGIDGLDAYRVIASGAEAFLEEEGIVGVEIGYDQARSVTELFVDQGFLLLEDAKDYGGNDRVLLFVKSLSTR